MEVGPIHTRYDFEYSGVTQGHAAVRDMIADIGRLAGAGEGYADRINQMSGRIGAGFQAVRDEIARVKPFQSAIDDAMRAADVIVGNSIIPDMRADVVQEFVKLRDQIAQVDAFAPSVRQAAEAQSAIKTRLADIQGLVQANDAAMKAMGISEKQAKSFFDNEGRMLEGAALARAADALRGNTSGGTVDLVADDDFEAVARLADEYLRLGAQIKDLNRESRDLRANFARLEQNQLATSYRQAEEAAESFTAAQRESVGATEALREINERVNQSLRERADITSRLDDEGDTGQGGYATEDEALAAFERLNHLHAEEATLLDEQRAAMERADAATRDYLQTLRQVETATERLRAARTTASKGAVLLPIDDTTNVQEDPQQARAAERAAAKQVEAAREVVEAIKASSAAANAEIPVQQRRAKIYDAVATSQAKQATTARQTVTSTRQVVQAAQDLGDAEAENIARGRQIEDLNIRKAVTAGEYAKALSLIGAAADKAADDEARLLALDIERNRVQSESVRVTGAAADEEGNIPAETSRAFRQAEQNRRKLADATIQNAIKAKEWSRAEQLLQAELDRTNAIVNKSIIDRTRLEQVEGRLAGVQNRPSTRRSLAGDLSDFLINDFKGVAAGASVAYVALDQLRKGLDAVGEGYNLAGQIELTQTTLNGFIGSVDRGNRVFQEGQEFAERYKLTQEELKDAFFNLAPLIRQSSVDTQKQLEITSRLLSLRPDQGFQGAAFSINEIAGGDAQSIRERFNLSLESANRIKAAVREGQDVFVAIEEELNRLGVGVELLDARLQGISGAQRDFAVASEGTKLALGELASDGLQNAQRFAAGVLRATTEAIGYLDDAKKRMEGGAGGFLGGAALGAIRGLFPQIGGLFTPNYFNEATEAAEELDPALLELADSIGVATNRFNAGRTSINEYYDELYKAATAQKLFPQDPFNLIGQAAGVVDLGQRINVLQANLQGLQTALAKDANLSPQIIPQILAITNEVRRLEALSPVEISVEVRVSQINALIGVMNAVVDNRRQVNQQLADLDNSYAQSQNDAKNEIAGIWADFGAERARAARDFGQQEARALRDFSQQQARARRDFQREEADAREDFLREDAQAAEEHARSLADIQEELGRDLIEIEEDTRDKLQGIQDDFDIDRTRDEEDFQRKRLKLIAEGKLAEAEELAEEFAIDQRRNEEDRRRDVSGAIDEGDDSIVDRRAEAERQTADAIEQFERDRAERRRNFELQRQEAREAFAQQQADAQAAFSQQRADASAAFAQQRADAAAAAAAQVAEVQANLEKERIANQGGRAKILLDQALFLEDQRKLFEQKNEEILEAERLKALGIPPAEAEALAALKTATENFREEFGNQAGVFLKGGEDAIKGWIEGMIKALSQSGPALDGHIRDVHDRLVPHSPIKLGPLKDLHTGGYNAGQMYMEHFAAGLSDGISLVESSLRDTTRIEMGLASPKLQDPRANAQTITLQATLPISATATVDGQTLVDLTSEPVAEFTIDVLSGAATIRNARMRPGRQQSNVRRLD